MCTAGAERGGYQGGGLTSTTVYSRFTAMAVHKSACLFMFVAGRLELHWGLFGIAQ